VAQEYFINSQTLEDQVRDLLPSQGGAGAGFDLTASTQIIPIIDLTPSAEGVGLREDLQRSFGYSDTTNFSIGPSVVNSTIISNTGYWRIKYTAVINANAEASIDFFDGTTQYRLVVFGGFVSSAFYEGEIEVFLSAGKSIRVNAQANTRVNGIFKQIASIDGTLSTPS
tara:strand:- start:300 stop:806 length:507 start_codon:yes stop_codon:yes gene_type:complete